MITEILKDTILKLLKERIGIRSNIRDEYLTYIIESILDELINEKGLSIDVDSPSHLMFIVDYSYFRYKSRDDKGNLPRHLQFRLHNLIVGDKSV